MFIPKRRDWKPMLGHGLVAVALSIGSSACGKSEPKAADAATATSATSGAGTTTTPATSPAVADPTAVPPPPAPPPADPPEVVAKRYIELGGAGGDLEAARKLVDPRCKNDKVWDVDAAKMMGTRLTIASVTIDVKTVTETKADVQTHVQGSARAENAESNSTIGGNAVAVRVGGLNVEGASLSEPLALAKIDGVWLVTCPLNP